MNLKYLFLFGLVLLILLALGCVGEKTSWPKTVEECDNDVCFQILVAQGYGDEKVCEKITLPNVKNMCFYYAARISQNPTICEKIEEYEDSTFTAYNTKITCQVVSKNQPEECTQLQIKDEATWQNHWTTNCLNDLAQLNSDPSICDALDGRQKSECYGFVAYYMGNVNICNTLPNEIIEGTTRTLQTDCKAGFFNLTNSNWPNWVKNVNK